MSYGPPSESPNLPFGYQPPQTQDQPELLDTDAWKKLDVMLTEMGSDNLLSSYPGQDLDHIEGLGIAQDWMAPQPPQILAHVLTAAPQDATFPVPSLGEFSFETHVGGNPAPSLFHLSSQQHHPLQIQHISQSQQQQQQQQRQPQEQSQFAAHMYNADAAFGSQYRHAPDEVVAAAHALSGPSSGFQGMALSSTSIAPPTAMGSRPLAMPATSPVSGVQRVVSSTANFAAHPQHQGHALHDSNQPQLSRHQNQQFFAVFGTPTSGWANSLSFSGQPPPRASLSVPSHAPIDEFNFGSDPNFNMTSFVPPKAVQNMSRAMEEEQRSALDCLQRNDSAAPTRTSSPVPHSGGSGAIASVKNEEAAPHASPPGSNPSRKRKSESRAVETAVHPEDRLSPPKRRHIRLRLSKGNGDDASAASSTTTELGSIHSAPRSSENGSAQVIASASHPSSASRASPPPVSPTAGAPAMAVGPATDMPKVAKPKRGGTKQPRQKKENLSEQQRRANHIKSEQKRRMAIKDGFDGLIKIVPSLRGNSSVSKSNILVKAGDYLEELQYENEEIRSILAEIDPEAAGSTEEHWNFFLEERREGRVAGRIDTANGAGGSEGATDEDR